MTCADADRDDFDRKWLRKESIWMEDKLECVMIKTFQSKEKSGYDIVIREKKKSEG
jgi:hypothetical protein